MKRFTIIAAIVGGVLAGLSGVVCAQTLTPTRPATLSPTPTRTPTPSPTAPYVPASASAVALVSSLPCTWYPLYSRSSAVATVGIAYAQPMYVSQIWTAPAGSSRVVGVGPTLVGRILQPTVASPLVDYTEAISTSGWWSRAFDPPLLVTGLTYVALSDTNTTIGFCAYMPTPAALATWTPSPTPTP